MPEPGSFTFLVTTDNHLGFREGDHLRRKDSYMAFKEALQIARDRDVDFILLGGDLFHTNKPSTSIEHKCIKIIRQHMSAPVQRPTSFKRVAGDFSHFRKLSHANFEDPNFSVPYPIMTIHGNHDDPTGPNSESICEKLATCGLLNYFGAVSLDPDTDCYTIEPIVLQKDSVRIALYGIGFIPDFKLKSAVDNRRLIFVSPPKDSYNVLVVHQNRVPYNKNKYIPDDAFPSFFHLIIRGHEHMTQAPEPLPSSPINGVVYQPGSTVATSIAPMESGTKKVGLIKVTSNKTGGDTSVQYKMNHELVELECCRRMLFRDISQKDIFKYIKQACGTNRINAAEFKKHSLDYIVKCTDELLKNNNSQKSSNTSSKALKLQRLDLPLVRIRIEYTTKNQRFDELELSSRYYPQIVANKDIVMFKKQKLQNLTGGDVENITFNDECNDENEREEVEEFDYVDLQANKKDTVEALIEDYFKNKSADEQLQVLSVSEYTKAVQGSIDDGNIISKIISKKKKLIFEGYKSAISNSDVDAESRFHDPEYVTNWFLKAFRGEEQSESQDSDVIVCD